MNAPPNQALLRSIYRPTGRPLNLDLHLESHHGTDHEDLLVLPLG